VSQAVFDEFIRSTLMLVCEDCPCKNHVGGMYLVRKESSITTILIVITLYVMTS
jgi:hypothetical protein